MFSPALHSPRYSLLLLSKFSIAEIGSFQHQFFFAFDFIHTFAIENQRKAIIVKINNIVECKKINNIV